MSVEVSNVMIQQWCKSRVWSVECWCWSAWSRRYIIIIPLCQGRAPQLQSLLLQVVLLESPVLGTSAQLPTLVPPAPVQEVWQIRWQFRSQLSYKLSYQLMCKADVSDLSSRENPIFRRNSENEKLGIEDCHQSLSLPGHSIVRRTSQKSLSHSIIIIHLSIWTVVRSSSSKVRKQTSKQASKQ